MESFYEYASEKQITTLLIKERVKIALKNKLRTTNPQNIKEAFANHESLSVTEHIFMLMPPRDLWVRPRRNERFQRQTSEPKKSKQIITQSLALTIRKHRKTPEKYAYLQRLDAFVQDIRREILSQSPLSFSSLRIMGKKKKVAADGQTIILRPLCVFGSLKEKLLISLANGYLSMAFDGLLHEEILSYRPLRYYHNSERKVLTNRDNAIANLLEYRRRFATRNIYVAECDIQKYFDTINHDVIRRCFGEFADKVKEQHPEFDYTSVGRIVDAYLDSYSFYNNILVENRRLSRLNPPQMYESHNERLFFERGCYQEAEFDACKSKIGIPQGGALSGLMSNVILSTIDRGSILCKADDEMFFSRYGDDILLMHTSKERCTALIESYCRALTEHKLLYHEFQSVGDARFKRKDGSVRRSIWDQKSRHPFLWGRMAGECESMDWIGFLGYEVRFTGEVRIRRSSLDEKYKQIKRQYKQVVSTRWASGKRDLADEQIRQKVSALILRAKSKGFGEAVSLNKNRYSITQAARLDRYKKKWMYRMLYKITCRNQQTPEQFNRYWQEVQDMGCANYVDTIP